MNKKDLDLVNKTLSNISDELLKALDILENNELSDEKSKSDTIEILDKLLMTIPVFMEIKN